MSNFWKIVCLQCGTNTDLLTDKHTRIICRECLNKNEFPEVESVLRDFDNEVPESKMKCMGIDNGERKIIHGSIEERLHESINEMDAGE